MENFCPGFRINVRYPTSLTYLFFTSKMDDFLLMEKNEFCECVKWPYLTVSIAGLLVKTASVQIDSISVSESSLQESSRWVWWYHSCPQKTTFCKVVWKNNVKVIITIKHFYQLVFWLWECNFLVKKYGGYSHKDFAKKSSPKAQKLTDIK